MSDPLVSVIMAVHNGGQFLREAVDSILGQTFKDFEFIIMDDGSTDSTPSLLAEYQSTDARIRLKRFDRNQGLTHCLNAGIQLARGKYLARMDADDVSLPPRLEEQTKFMDQHPEIDVLGTGYTLIDESGNHLRSTAFSSNPDILKWDLLFFNPIAHPSAMMRSSTIRKLGGYNTEVARAQDGELWFRVSIQGRLANLEEVHMLLRLHGGRVTTQYRAQQIASHNAAKQKYLQIVLNRDVPDAIISSLKRKPATAQEAAMVAETIMDYCNYCCENTSAQVQEKILGQAAEKVARKIGRFIIYPVTWKICLRFCLQILRFIVNRWRAGHGPFRRNDINVHKT